MASFSITKLDGDEQYAKAFEGVKVSSVFKDYHKDCYPVHYNEESFLSLKFPGLIAVGSPAEGDKFFYAKLAKSHDPALDVFEALDEHLSSQLDDSLIQKLKPTFKNIGGPGQGLIKLYIPYKSGKINYSKMKVFDTKKEPADFKIIKENSPIKVLAYLKQFKRYRTEVIPMWVIEQIQVVEPKKKVIKIKETPPDPEEIQVPAESPETKDNKPEVPEVPEEPEEKFFMDIRHSTLENPGKLELDEDPEDENSEVSDSDYQLNAH